jgi:hypothetical protein
LEKNLKNKKASSGPYSMLDLELYI